MSSPSSSVSSESGGIILAYQPDSTPISLKSPHAKPLRYSPYPKNVIVSPESSLVSLDISYRCSRSSSRNTYRCPSFDDEEDESDVVLDDTLKSFMFMSSPDSRNDIKVKQNIIEGIARFSRDLSEKFDESRNLARNWYEKEKSHSEKILRQKNVTWSDQLKSLASGKESFLHQMESHLKAESDILAKKIAKLELEEKAKQKEKEESEAALSQKKKEEEAIVEAAIAAAKEEEARKLKEAEEDIKKKLAKEEKQKAEIVKKQAEVAKKEAETLDFDPKEKEYFDHCKSLISDFKAFKEKTALVTDSTVKNAQIAFRMRINKRIGQVSADQNQVSQVSKDLSECLSEAVKTGGLDLFNYCALILCQKILEQCEKQVSDLFSAAFPLALVWINVNESIESHISQTLSNLLFGCLSQANPYIVPFFFKPSEFPSPLKYHEAVGSKVKEESDGSLVQLEAEDVYWSRMSGIMAFVAALQYVHWQEFIVKKRQMVNVSVLTPMSTLKDGYLWLMRIGNQKGRKVTSSLIHAMLSIAGHGLFSLYPNSMKKYIEFLKTEYISQHLPSSSMAANVRLELFVEESIVSKNFNMEPYPGSTF